MGMLPFSIIPDVVVFVIQKSVPIPIIFDRTIYFRLYIYVYPGIYKMIYDRSQNILIFGAHEKLAIFISRSKKFG